MAAPAAPGWRARDPLPATLVALTALTGLVDAVSFFGLGQVFTANMSGNIALLGLAVAGADGLSAGGHLISLAGFTAGAVLGAALLARLAHLSRPRWLLALSTISGVLVGLAAVAAVGLSEHHASTAERAPVIVLVAAAMGMRAAAAYHAHLAGLPVSVVTSTLTGLVTDATLGHGGRLLGRAAAVGALFAGAVAGGALVLNLGLAWALALAALAGPAITLACALHPSSRDSRRRGRP